MILQALVEYYEILVSQGKLERPGRSKSGISYALYIDGEGDLKDAFSLRENRDKGGKQVLVPRSMSLPAPVKRSSGISPNFLWDNSSYILGIDEKDKPQRSLECFNACRELHHKLLDCTDSPAAKALLAFFDRWNPEKAGEHPVVAENPDILSGANLTFWYNGSPVCDDPIIQAAWQEHYDSNSGGGKEMICLATGKKGPIAATHPSVKGVAGAQSSGAALVSFNAPAFCSYGHEQNFNAPMSKYAAFAYTSALNYLLEDKEHIGRIGDTTVLFWAKDGSDVYRDFFMCSTLEQSSTYSAKDLLSAMQDLCKGIPADFEKEKLNPEMDFYILGLAPNAARLSVRFFLKNSFGNFVKNINAHYNRLHIVKTKYNEFDLLYLPTLLDGVVNPNSKLYNQLLGDLTRAVFTNAQYPAALRNFTFLRIRSDRDINRTQASVLKAYLIKRNEKSPQLTEVYEKMEKLDENSTLQPYLLGRLFAVMEQIQLASANWKLNRSIKDSFFNSVTVTPKLVFSKLFPLNEYHMKKLKREKPYLARSLETEKSKIIGAMHTAIPVRFKADEVDSFYIGYYHQSSKYEGNDKKEEKENV